MTAPDNLTALAGSLEAATGADRVPLETTDDLATLDSVETVEGYSDGFANFPCGSNRSRSYWHGWRNGKVDGGHREPDASQAILAHNYVKSATIRAKIAEEASHE